MSKASRVRRQKKDKERQRRRAARAQAADGSTAGPRGRSGGPFTPSRRERITFAVGEAVRAVCCGDATARDESVGYLTADRGPDFAEVVSREIVRFLRMSVSAAWRHGWQPAELTRRIRRELGAAHETMVADVIADEVRDYPAAAVDGQWTRQVVSVAPDGVWWGSAAEYLASWAKRAPGEAPVATAVELLHELQHLPALEKLCPPPGSASARPGSAANARTDADERILGKIRALLAKAEATEFSQEAEALSARAQELMAKYSIDHVLLNAAAGTREEPGGRRLPVDNPYEAPKASLLQVIAQANRCQSVWHQALGMTTVVGFPADLDAVELLYTSLLVQAGTAMLREGAKQDRYGRSRTRAFRQSFLVSYGIRIGERLSEAVGHAERLAADAAPGRDLLPVLRARHEAVEGTFDDWFGERLMQGKATRATDGEGWASGRAAADLASLHGRAQVSS